METQDECIFYEDYPMRTRLLPEGVYIAYRVPGTKGIETAQVLHAGYYVMLAKDSQGNKHFIFYRETLAASSSLDTLKRKDVSRLKIRAFVLSWEAGEAWNTAWAVRLLNRCASTKAGCEMIIFDEDRPSDSPFVERVWRCHSEGAAPFLSIAASRCELVVTRLRGKVTMTVRGPETRATPLGDCPGDGEWLGILLKLGTFLPLLPTRTLVDAEVNLPAVSRNSFWLFGSTWQLPDYDNADTFVDWLARKGLLAREPVVDAALQGHLKDCSLSTIQRRFLRATGLTQSAARQIERARSATHLLQQGVSILDTVLEAGYFDQPHLTRSLKYLIGQTPAQILQKSRPEQMPFLYKTTPFG